MKKIHIQSKELLSCMCEEIPTISQTRQLTRGGVYDAINRAVKNGIFEFVSTTVGMDPRFLEMEDTDSRNIFMLAVLYRQSKIFGLIYELDMKHTLTSHKDREDNNMLHMAGIVEDSTRLNRSSGAALQMQRELQWFKEVERIVNPNIKENTNKDGLTPRQLFTKNHEDMMEKGEKWMKDTALSCTVVGALIVTIMSAFRKLVDPELKSQEDLGIADYDGSTALMKALVYGRSELARYLYPLASLNDLVLAEELRFLPVQYIPKIWVTT
ncbi:uncharacterized protein LOC121241459 [Juglans microcarpa x Juglans regia]|uniref:uncharacterized protein LOC121241459 n=1 Tax=Juglans microcarpa x Juglans regia TaxID=2249226 RepID=UPI001B7DA5A3|nr:uncharacterized protein LOC121241459 [Juglans microcarpa x Juglans regia]